MSETCHPGIAYILQLLYGRAEPCLIRLLTHNVCHTSKEDGMRGMELPYQLRSDWMVTSVLFLCFYSGIIRAGTWQETPLNSNFKNFCFV